MKNAIVALLVFCLSVPAIAGQELTFSSAGDANARVSFAVLKEAYAKLGITVHNKRLPAQRSMVESSEGRTDGEVNRIIEVGDRYPTLVRVPHPVSVARIMPYTCRPDLKTTDWNSLSALRVGVRNGIVLVEKMTKDMKTVTTSRTYAELFNLLVMGRLDVVPCDDIVGAYHTNDLNTPCLRSAGPPLMERPLYHYLHESVASIVPKITAVLEEMDRSGEMASIRKKAIAGLTLD